MHCTGCAINRDTCSFARDWDALRACSRVAIGCDKNWPEMASAPRLFCWLYRHRDCYFVGSPQPIPFLFFVDGLIVKRGLICCCEHSPGFAPYSLLRACALSDADRCVPISKEQWTRSA